MTSLHSTILKLFAEHPERTAYRLQRDAGVYRALKRGKARQQALQLSAFLQEKGVGPGDRVVLISENGPEWPVAALAVLNLRAVLVPMAAIASPLEVENTLKSASPKFCFFSRSLPGVRRLEEILKSEQIASFGWDLQSEEPLAGIGTQTLELDQLASEKDTALLIYTSGTTGQPKGVPITHGNILSNALAATKVIAATENDRFVSVLPLSHMFEFTAGFVFAALGGAEVTYVKSLRPDDLLKALQNSKATMFLAVPLLFEVIGRNLQKKLQALPAPVPAAFTIFSRLTRAFPQLGKFFFYPVHRSLGGHLRFLGAGGAKLHPQTFEFFRGLGITVLQGYGLTETSPVLTFTTQENAAPDHVGAALPGVELGIFNEKAEKLPLGQEGEIWAKGPNIFGGYLDPQHNKDVFQNGWFKTGDLGTLDEQGLLRITGRKKDIIVTAAGKNVYPEEIEGLLLASGNFLEVAVLGMKDQAGHEKITLVAVPDRAQFPGMNQEQIREQAKARARETTHALADYKWPQRTEIFFTELPKTSTRKVKKHELRKALEAEALNAKAAAPAGANLDLSIPLERAIAEGIAEITRQDASSVRLDDLLAQGLGLDSLTFVELLGRVENQFHAQIEGVEFASIQTVRDLVRALEFLATQKAPKRKKRVWFSDFSPRANRRLLWRIPRRIFNSLLRIYLQLRHHLHVDGLENLEGNSAYVFTPNHSSHFDLLSLASALPHRLVQKTFAVAAKDYFFDRTWKALGARILVNAIPFDRKGRVNESMEKCRAALASGDSLVIFPEGTRSPDGELQDFKPGVGQLLAGKENVRAVPVLIEGAFQIMPKGTSKPGPGKLRIRFGKPISFQGISADSEGYKKVVERLRAEVVDLSRGRLH